MITIENYEAYLLQYAEGTLSQEECTEVEAFLENHPDLKEEMEQFYDMDLKVTAPKVEMPNKQALKHQLVMPIVWRSVVAACIVGGAIVLGVNLFAPQQEVPLMAEVEQPMCITEFVTDTIITDEVAPMPETKIVSTIDVAEEIELKIEECDEDTMEISTPIFVEEKIEMEEIKDVEYPILTENDQLIAMAEDKPNVIQSDQLIKVVEPVIIQSDDLIDVEAMSLKMVVDQYITTPLKAHAERTKGKVVEQLYAMTDEIKQRYINNFNNPQL